MPHQPNAQRTPAIVMKVRGPRRSISQPESGIVQVITAMKKLNPHCTSDNFQPVADMIGWTAMVHAYCRFPIIIMATTAAASRNQRFILQALLASLAAARFAASSRAAAYTVRV